MSPLIATIICILGIVLLFVLDQDPEVHPSRALCLPVVWLGIAGSRTVSQWLVSFGFGHFETTMDSAGAYLEGSPLDRNVFLALTLLGIGVLLRRGAVVKSLLRANGPVLLFF